MTQNILKCAILLSKYSFTHFFSSFIPETLKDCPLCMYRATRLPIHTKRNRTWFLPTSTHGAGETQLWKNNHKTLHEWDSTGRAWLNSQPRKHRGRKEGLRGGRREQKHVHRDKSTKQCPCGQQHGWKQSGEEGGPCHSKTFTFPPWCLSDWNPWRT